MKFVFRLVFLIVFGLSILGNLYFAATCHHSIEPSKSPQQSEGYTALVKNDTTAYRKPNQTSHLKHSLTGSVSSQSSKNLNVSVSDMKYFKAIFGPSTVPMEEEQFTVLIMTYKRSTLLRTLIPHYCAAGERLHKVLLVWNDVESEVPQYLKDIHCEVKLEFIISKINKLTNRFIPYLEIETEGMLY